MRRRWRRGHREDRENTDRWMVSYADFVTLLFAVFTTLYALSHLDVGKVQQFAGSVRGAFTQTAPPVRPQQPPLIAGIKPVSPDVSGLEREFQEVLAPIKDKSAISLRRDDRGLIVSLGDALLFESGSAELKSSARPALDAIASVLQARPNEITVEGHTDDIPIHTDRFPSNWELSTMRATNILRYMTQNYGLPASRFSAAGYGEQRPIAPNVTLDGRSKNRRVDIVIHVK